MTVTVANDVITGAVINIETKPTGTWTNVAHAAGATVIAVQDTYDLSERGGSVTIAGVNYAYLTIDVDASTMTLATGLTGAVDEGIPVYVFPPSSEKWAMVRIEDGSDAINARVPHSLADKFAEGIRDIGQQESVLIVVERSAWAVKDIVALPPIIDASYVGPDTTIPNPPTNLGLTTAAYFDNQGGYLARVDATWDAPTLNTDGSTLIDLDGYEVQYKPTGSLLWTIAGYTFDVDVAIEGLVVGKEYTFRVRAKDSGNHTSGWLTSTPLIVGTDTTPPSQPAAPTLTSARGTITATHGFAKAAGGAIEADTAWMEIHLSQTNGFTSSSATLKGSISEAGSWVIADLPVNTSPWYSVVVAVDRSGNRSVQSPQSSPVTLQVISATDLAADIIADIDQAIADSSTALTNANTALTAANGKNKVIHSLSDPSGTGFVAGDTWFKYNGSEQVIGMWRHNGTTWVAETLRNEVIATLDAAKITTGTLDAARIAANSLTISQVNGLQTAIDVKTRTFAQPGIPTSTAAGDFWVDTDDNNKIYRAFAAGVTTIGASGWVLYSDPTAKTKTFAQTSIPVSTAIGDIWMDTDDNNRVYRAASIGADQIVAGEWVEVTDPRTALNAATINNWTFTGQTTIDGGKIQTDTIQAVAIKAGAIGVRELAVTDTSNMVELSIDQASQTLVAVDASGNPVSTVMNRVYDGTTYYWFERANNANTYFFRNLAGPIPFVLGNRLRFTYSAYTTGVGTTSSATPRVRYESGAGWNLSPVGGSPTTIDNTPRDFTYEGDVPGNTTTLSKFVLMLASSTGVDVRTRNARCFLMNAGELVVDGTITADKLAVNSVTADKILAGAITADKLASTIVLASTFYAGPTTGTHVELSATGFHAFKDPVDEGNPYEYVTLGVAGSSDVMRLTDANGNPTVTITDTGVGAFSQVLSTDDPLISGLPLFGNSGLYGVPSDADAFVAGWMDMWPRGLQRWGSRGTNSSTIPSGTEAKYMEVQASLKANRNYLIYCSTINFLVPQPSAGVDGRMLFRLRITTDGTNVGTGSTQITWQRGTCQQGFTSASSPMEYILTLGSSTDDVDVRILLTYTPEGNGGQIFPSGQPVIMAIYDIGPKQLEAGIDWHQVSPPPVGTTLKRYTSVWRSTTSEAYGFMSTGSPYKARTDAGDMMQGYFSSNQDNQFSYALMLGNAVSGETSKTIASALSGATVEKVEAWVYPLEFPTQPSGSGTLVLRNTSATSLPANPTFPSATGKSQGFVEGTGEWVDITSLNGGSTSIRGIIVGGSPASTSNAYYARIADHDNSVVSRRPMLRITYTR